MRAPLLAVVGLAGCANLLSFDEYSPRVSGDASTDTSMITEAAVDGAEAGPMTEGVHPPPRPAGAIRAGGGKTLWLEVNHFYLNQRDISSGKASPTAWRSIGYDIDHVCTGLDDSKANIGTCRRVSGAAQGVLLDGDDCRDNNFGSQVVPLVNLADSEYEALSNDGIARGVNTWLLQLSDLDDGPDDPFVVGRLYKTSAWYDAPHSQPKFDGTDVREVDAESVIDFDLSKPRTFFPNGYLAGDVFVSGDPGDFEASLPIQGISVTMPLKGGVLALRLDRAHSTGVLGTIAGGIPAAALSTVLEPIAGQAGICPGDPLYNGLFDSIGKMMDLVVGAPHLRDTNVECNALSIGLAFTAARAQPAVSVVTVPPPIKHCTMGDGGTG